MDLDSIHRILGDPLSIHHEGKLEKVPLLGQGSERTFLCARIRISYLKISFLIPGDHFLRPETLITTPPLEIKRDHTAKVRLIDLNNAA